MKKNRDIEYGRGQEPEGAYERARETLAKEKTKPGKFEFGQLTVFWISLIFLMVFLYIILTGDLSDLFKISYYGRYRFNMPPILFVLIAAIICFYSARNVLRSKNREGKKKRDEKS